MIVLPTCKRLRLMLLFSSLVPLLPIAAFGADTPSLPAQPPQLTIVRQSGKEGGDAQMIVKGRAHKIAANAVQAWPVREGQGALILVLAHKASGSAVLGFAEPEILYNDYRETWSKNPDMIRDSYIGFEPDVDGSYTTDLLKIPPPSKFFQDRFTIGVSFAF